MSRVPSLCPPERGKQKHNSETNYETDKTQSGAVGRENVPQCRQNITNNNINMSYKNTTQGQVKGTTWGAMCPPERPPFGRGTGKCVRVPKYKGFAVHFKKNARGSPYTHKNIMNAHVECRGSRPCAHLRGENKNITARQTMRRTKHNRAQWGGKMCRNADKISPTTTSTCPTRTQHRDK